MCGRFAFYSPTEATTALFGVTTDLQIEARYNIAPGQYIAAIRGAGPETRELVMLRWGLVPGWAKDARIGNRMINARAETITEKPSFRHAYKYRRCLIPASGFYEWRKEPTGKTPYFITRADNSPIFFAGIWENWQSGDCEKLLQTTCIITTRANKFMTRLHHRMPLMLDLDDVPHWLSGDNDLINRGSINTPALQAWPVDRRVNNPTNESPALIERLL